jgi:hypothetical protein
MNHVGSVYIDPQPGGLFTLRRVNHQTGAWATHENLAPSEVVPSLVKWGMEVELIKMVEKDLPNMVKGGS